MMGSSKKSVAVADTLEQKEKPAGEFSSWLRRTRRGLRLNVVGADVPCGECTACCRSSMFIHIRPHETRTLKRIPKALQFPASGLPKGNMLMGYDEKGECPMFINDKCSIYEDRPQTCRDYDCRIFAATRIALDESAQPLIAEQIMRWRFEYPTELGRNDHAAISAAAAFLQEHRDGFLHGKLPNSPTHLALLAIRVYNVFSKVREDATSTGASPPDAEIARAVLKAMGKLGLAPRKAKARR
jgi:uncharacterized protein